MGAPSEVLYTKHRPQSFANVVGQDEVVRALQTIINKRSAQSFIFAGPSGTGKTTLARIAARELECSERDLIEIDAATNTGVDDMRLVKGAVQFRPLYGKTRVVIIDECHSLSKNAWQSLLKVVEEPPMHAYFFFCTTEPGKVPATIKTRCVSFTLKAVSDAVLEKLVKTVAKKEGMTLLPDVLSVIVREARGSPRQVLVNLSTAHSSKTKKEAAELLEGVAEDNAVIELCRLLLTGGSWSRAMSVVKNLEDTNPESVRIVVCNYMASVLVSCNSDKRAQHVLHILDCFSTPYNASENRAPLLLSIGQVLML